MSSAIVRRPDQNEVSREEENTTENTVANNADESAAVPQQGNQENMWSMLKKIAYRMVIFYLISNLIRGFFQSSNVSGPTNVTTSSPASRPSHNLYRFLDHLDFYIYLSETDDKLSQFNTTDHPFFWHLKNFKYGDWSGGPNSDGSFTKSANFPVSDSLQNNGSVYLHVFVTKAGYQPDPQKQPYSKMHTFYKCHRLNKFKKKRYQKTANLLTGKSEQSEEDTKKAETITAEILSHWHPNITMNIVTDQTNWVPGSVPPPLDEYIEFEPITRSHYYPPLFFNDYWNLMSDYQAINKSVTVLNFTLTISPISLFKWQLYAAQNMRNKWSKMFGASSAVSSLFDEEDQQEDQDSLKQAMLDTNPYLLGLTVAVSILHTIFEFLAFKNDIQFWRNRKSLEGLSVKSVVFNLMTSVIVLLYILDNETNFVVRLSVGVGVLIELWKIPKCMDVSLDGQRKLFGLIPMICVKDKGSYVKSSTKEYDTLAFKYLSWLLYPLLVGYAVYSLLYQEHRGWYSWILSMLYGFLLTFGFIMMTPQLFINYKLKSVAHLPWRMLSYKFLNTFIDDIFAFVIKMPTMYRIGCFRDDIVFLVYVYQRWIYRVDPHRLNEFGTSGEMENQQPGQLSITTAADSGQTETSSVPAAEETSQRSENETKKDK